MTNPNGVSPWKAIRLALIDVFTIATTKQITSPGGIHLPFETPAWAAEWKDRRMTMIHPAQGFSLWLNITSVVGRGNDDYAYPLLDTGLAVGEPATGLFDVYEVSGGLRRFTLQAQCWCLEESDDNSSFDIIERLRTQLDLARNRQKLLDVNVDFTDVMMARDMTTKINNKSYSITALDFVFTACVLVTDPIPTGYIETVIVTSHERAGSDEVSESLRMNEEELSSA